MERIPKKNISHRFADIKIPGIASKKRIQEKDTPINSPAAAAYMQNNSRASQDGTSARSGSFPKKFLIFVSAVFIVSTIVVIFGAVAAKSLASRMLKENSATIQKGVSDFENFRFKEAGDAFQNVNESVEDGALSQAAASFEGIRNLLPFLKTGFGAFTHFQKIGISAVELAQSFGALSDSAIRLMREKRGDEVITLLEHSVSSLENIAEESKKLGQGANEVSSVLAGGSLFNFSDADFNIDVGVSHLKYLVSWLKAKKERHIIVIFSNTSEVRPGGGFWGSFADVTMVGANIQDIVVHDIGDIDRDIGVKVIPPKPLQDIVRAWRSADSNWFFNFPDSAAKFIEFAQASPLYKDISIDGVISVSPRVFQDVLKVTGPLAVSSSMPALTTENFMREIQKQIQDAQANKSSSSKKIIGQLVPALFNAVVKLETDASQNIALGALEWGKNRDIMAYFTDPELQAAADSIKVTGREFVLPENFNGDYLAPIFANIGGEKSDFVMKQKVFVGIQLDTSGVISDRVTITHSHTGRKDADWWYRATNKGYLQVLTPADSHITNFSGGWERHILSPLNYKAAGYSTDNMVEGVEKTGVPELLFPGLQTFKTGNKNIFSTWVKTLAGTTSTLQFEYTHRAYYPVSDGRVFTFVFERQQGVSGEYQIEIVCPVGFHWKEVDSPVYEYTSSEIPGRLEIELTLEHT